MTRLSVNINKIATLRNARGGDVPSVVQAAIDCQHFGADGITIHPRPDERHITTQDVYDLKKVVTTEYNIEGYPDKRFLELIQDVKPEQATLVPDSPDVLTSNAGWDTIKNADLLKDVISALKKEGACVSLFTETDLAKIEGAKKVGADRVELYTGPYAENYSANPDKAIGDYVAAAEFAKSIGLEVNAGHDLNLENLKFLKERIPFIHEVSIGHALIADALYFGLENVIPMYKKLVQ